MRLQWNKISSVEIKEDNTSYERHAGYVCPCCGLELYGQWWHTFEGADKVGSPIYKKMQEEAIAFSQLAECPYCGEALKHESAYFLQVEGVWGGYEWEIDRFFFENHVCLYAPNHAVLGWDAAMEAVWKVNTVDKMYAYMQDQRHDVEKRLANDALTAFCARCDIPIAITVNTSAVTIIKTDPIQLQEYLLSIIHVEKNIKELQQRLLFLYSASYRVKREAKLAQIYPTIAEREAAVEVVEEMAREVQRKSDEISALRLQRVRLSGDKIVVPAVVFPIEPIKPTEPTYATPNLFNRKKVADENVAKAAAYKAEIERYERELEEYPVLLNAAKKKEEELRKEALAERERQLSALDSEIADKTAALQKFKAEIDLRRRDIEARIECLQNNADYVEVQLKMLVDEEISKAEETLAALYAKKHQLYGADIIFGKYRDLVAVSSFYEYLLSGRCETLGGANGCYNLFESEIRANIIINKLEAIGNSLERIKDNQYMLYSQLNEINSGIYTLEAATTELFNLAVDSTAALLEHASVIAYNSAVTSFYSNVTATIASADRYIGIICW